MILAVVPAARAVRWDGTNVADVEAVCGGRTTAPAILSRTAIVIDAWGYRPMVVNLDDWVVSRSGRVKVLEPQVFWRRYKVPDRKALAA